MKYKVTNDNMFVGSKPNIQIVISSDTKTFNESFIQQISSNTRKGKYMMIKLD